jgi:hypothetical protein
MEPPDPDQVNSLADLIEFLQALAMHFGEERENDDAWAHWFIGDYLEATAAWLAATPAVPEFREVKEREIDEGPSWRGVALMFAAGRTYE